MGDAIARVHERAQASRDRRQEMREKWPDHARLTDWARAGGLEVAAVTVGDKTFGRPLPDGEIPPVYLVSDVVRAYRDGTWIAPRRVEKLRYGRRLERDVDETEKGAEYV